MNRIYIYLFLLAISFNGIANSLDVEHELIEVLQEIAKEKGFNLVLNASRSGALVYADRELVITDEVLARLNKRIQAVPLEVKK